MLFGTVSHHNRNKDSCFQFWFPFFSVVWWEQPRTEPQNLWWCLARTGRPITFGGSTLSFPWAHATYVVLQAGDAPTLADLPSFPCFYWYELAGSRGYCPHNSTSTVHPFHSPNLYTRSFNFCNLCACLLLQGILALSSPNSKLRNH